MNSLEKQLDPAKDYITLLIKLPINAMDLRSAEMFRRSMLPVANLQNLTKNSMTISHMMVAWKCGKIKGMTGQTGELSNQGMKAFLGGWGLSGLYAVYQDGMAHTPEYVQQKYDESIAAGFPFGHVTFEVDRAQCENMLAFLKDFIDHPNAPASKFGLSLRPENFEGGGCGSFASAMLSKAGLLSTLHSSFWRSLRGPRELMGSRSKLPPLTAIDLPADVKKAGRKISLNRLEATPWTGKTSPPLHMVDPELVTYVLRTLAEDYWNGRTKNTAGLDARAFDERVIYSVLPYVTNEVQQEWIPIRESDPAVAKVAIQARREIAALKSRAYRLRPSAIGTFWGLIVER